ncbi:MAG: hypothetical protein ACR2L8_10190 [Solirubrobacteraceae bacterium]
MRPRGLPVAAAAALALLAAGPSAGAQPERHSAGATLTPRGLSPLALKGSGFKRRERVKVTVTPTGRDGETLRMRAKRNGAFTATFPGVMACDGVEALAVGRRGSRASFQLSSVGCAGP